MYTKLIVLSLSAWFFLSVFIDFIVVPGAFKIVGDIFKAGNLGITVFTAFNKFEVLFGAILVFSYFKAPDVKYRKVKNVIVKIVTSIAIYYYWYLSTKIADLTKVLIAGGEQKLVAVAQKDHNFYHNLYVKLDAVKILLLFVLIFLEFLPYMKRFKKEVPA